MRTRLFPASVIMPMLQSTKRAFTGQLFYSVFYEAGLCIIRPNQLLGIQARQYTAGLHKCGKRQNCLKSSPICTKSSHIFRRLHRPDGFFWCDRQPFHQPAELMPRQRTYLLRAARPLETAFGEFLILQEPSNSLPYKSFDAVWPPAAEKIKRIRDIWPVPGLCFYQRRKPDHAGAQICISADDIHGFKTCSVIEYVAPP